MFEIVGDDQLDHPNVEGVSRLYLEDDPNSAAALDWNYDNNGTDWHASGCNIKLAKNLNY